MTPEHFVREHGPRLRALAARLVGEGDADDIVQRAWVAAWLAKPRSPGAWLDRVVRRIAGHHRRELAAHRERERRAAGTEPGQDPTAPLERREALEALAAGLAALPSAWAEIVLLRHADGMPTQEIAKRLGMPVNTVRSRAQRGLVRLREELERRGTDWRPALAFLVVPSAREPAAAASLGVLLMSTKTIAAMALAVMVLAAFAFDQLGSSRPAAAEYQTAVGIVDSGINRPSVETALPANGPARVLQRSAETESTKREPGMPPTLMFVVRDAETREPLANAAIELRIEDGLWESVGVTNLAGQYEEGKGMSLTGSLIRARAEGYAPLERVLSEVDVEERVMPFLLGGAASITGSFVLRSGDPLYEEGLMVVAVESRSRLSKQVLRHAIHGESSWPTAMSDSSGRFQIDGLEPDRKYRLLSGGKGVWSGRAKSALGGEVDVELAVDIIVGALVRVRTIDGHVPVAASGLWSTRGGTSIGHEGAHFHAGQYEGAFLDEAIEQVELETWDKLILARSVGPTLLDSLGFSLEIPGYLLATGFQVPVRPVSEGVSAFDVTVTETAEGWGSLQIRFPASLNRTTGSVSDIAGRVTLSRGGGLTDYWFDVPSSALSAGEYTLSNIPYGDYEVSYKSLRGFWRWPSFGEGVSLSIAEGAAKFRIEAPALGDLEIHFTANGEPFGGRASIEVWPTQNESGVVTFCGFGGPPYVIEQLPLGQYRLRVFSGAGKTTRFTNPVDVPSEDRQVIEIRLN